MGFICLSKTKYSTIKKKIIVSTPLHSIEPSRQHHITCGSHNFGLRCFTTSFAQQSNQEHAPLSAAAGLVFCDLPLNPPDSLHSFSLVPRRLTLHPNIKGLIPLVTSSYVQECTWDPFHHKSSSFGCPPSPRPMDLPS